MMDDTTAAPAAPKLTFTDVARRMLARMFGLEQPLTPQKLAAEHAFVTKQQNAHRFAPRHPPYALSQAEPVVLPEASVFITANPRFPLNPCLVRRGMDAKTFKASMRGSKRSKERGYLRGDCLARFNVAGAGWSEAKLAKGLAIAPVNAPWAKA